MNFKKKTIFLNEISLNCDLKLMKSKIKLITILLIIVTMLGYGCASKKVFCGCPNERGMVGYK
jgi:hypothetical protein